MNGRLKDKVAIVTGATKGIGAATALMLAQEGASVVVNYPSKQDNADKTVSEIKKQGGKAVAIKADVSKPADIERLFQETEKVYGKIDILVNNAGIYEFASIDEITLKHYYKIFNLNVLGILWASKVASHYFGEKGGCIINISSIVSTIPFGNTAVYSGSKAAVDAFTRALSLELGPRKIRVNSINPGLVDTPGTHLETNTAFRDKFLNQTALGRVGQPDDIAKAVLFLASEDSSWITGQTLFVTGGYR